MFKPFIDCFKDYTEDKNIGMSFWREKKNENSIYLAIYLWWIALYIGFRKS